ncbi:MAG: molybdate ABC transporter substrate-binding protein [Candidatus Limnocylindrales bacterium]
MTFRLAFGLAFALLLAACGSRTASPGTVSCCDPTAPHVELTVFAAASLKGALDQVKVAYETGDESVTLTISTDSSAALETQIEQGAPADVFLSADTASPTKLVDGGFALGDAVVFAMNALTIIVPTGNPAGIATPADLANPGVRIIAAGDEVPITKYAKKLIENLAANSADATAFTAACTSNTVTRVENVKAIVAQIELGQGDAGIVYVTDANASKKVETIEVPPDLNVPATYAGVVVKASANAAAARAFLAWFAGVDGQAILATLGFLPPAP